MSGSDSKFHTDYWTVLAGVKKIAKEQKDCSVLLYMSMYKIFNMKAGLDEHMRTNEMPGVFAKGVYVTMQANRDDLFNIMDASL